MPGRQGGLGAAEQGVAALEVRSRAQPFRGPRGPRPRRPAARSARTRPRRNASVGCCGCRATSCCCPPRPRSRMRELARLPAALHREPGEAGGNHAPVATAARAPRCEGMDPSGGRQPPEHRALSGAARRTRPGCAP
ncbi:hypothetical protein QJS66_21685 [Kocuria rhizophila]|nr:hypothetical protein QJS66_21685 [Kocuria rhizophila]